MERKRIRKEDEEQNERKAETEGRVNYKIR
jgi:hypothetical protein